MMNLSTKNRRISLIILDSIAIVVSFFLSILLRFDFIFPTSRAIDLFPFLPMIIVTQIVFFTFSKFYDVIWRFTSLWDMYEIIKTAIITNLISIVLFSFYKGAEGYPRSVLLIFLLLNILTVSFIRIAVRLFHHTNQLKSNKKNIYKKNIVLVGAGNTGEKIAREIKTSANSPYNLVGFFDDDLSIKNSTLHGVKIYGPVKELNNLSIKFDEILLTLPSVSGNKLREIIKVCKKTGKKYKTVPTLFDMINKDISLANVRNISYADLLGRDEVSLDMNSIEKMMKGKRILISGAGGSIGSELVRQCLIFKPSEIICLDYDEEKIFNLEQELNIKNNITILKYPLCSVRSPAELEKVFSENHPQIVFHAAAYKHVPIQEKHPWSAVKTNVQGTLNIVNMSDKYEVELFVQVSTDKAVNPVNVMGATKGVAEKIIQSFNVKSKTSYMAVRFGNVLGSSGSAIPTFEKQISKGGPLTITHPEITRYFMSIQEACQLILQCGVLGKKGEIFLLEMGRPIKILHMAKDLIRLSGLEPDIDIPIVFTGLRPGEKLYEELQLKDEKRLNTDHKKIMILENSEAVEQWSSLVVKVTKLLDASNDLSHEKIRESIKQILPSYRSKKDSFRKEIKFSKNIKYDKTSDIDAIA